MSTTMESHAMKKFTGAPCHDCAPKEWRKTPVFSGSYELDANIARSKNGDLARRMKFYAEDDNAYGPKTGYSGYHGYSGDD